ncbi:putative orphan protein [Pseudoalteromonas luteoviolacea B = ATCC 29581]|nr:putative orphan protein [Pseudoalteromonas luteoviolacea B = ATCC 29581]
MNKKPFDEMLKQEIQNLPDEITPTRELWPGVERAISSEAMEISASTNIKPWLGVAVCLGAALFSVLMIMKQEPNNAVLIADFFESQKQSLLVRYQSQPALTDNWQAQLVELEAAEAAIRQALDEDPQNAALLRMLSQVYQQQLDLITKVHQPTWQQI